MTKTRKRTTAHKSVSAQRSARDRSDAGGSAGAPSTKRASSGSSRGDRAKRLLDLVMLLLRARSPVTFREIRDQFSAYQTANAEAGLRAFERDKADLLELGVPIRYVTPEEDDALEEGGYVVELRRYRMPEVQLTADEVSALVLASTIARAIPGGNYDSIVDLAVKKLAFDMPDLPDTPTEFPLSPSAIHQHTPVLVHFPESGERKLRRELSDRFAALEAATRNRKRATFRYREATKGIVRKRTIDPYGLVYRGGRWLVVGYCHLRKDVRTFRLDRILDLAIAPKPKTPDFERPPDFDVRRYTARSPWTFDSEPPEHVELEFGPQVAAAANEDFGPGAERDRAADGSVRVRFRCGNLDYAASRVLMAKGAIRVVRGDRLRARIADELAAVAERYA